MKNSKIDRSLLRFSIKWIIEFNRNDWSKQWFSINFNIIVNILSCHSEKFRIRSFPRCQSVAVHYTATTTFTLYYTKIHGNYTKTDLTQLLGLSLKGWIDSYVSKSKGFHFDLFSQILVLSGGGYLRTLKTLIWHQDLIIFF